MNVSKLSAGLAPVVDTDDQLRWHILWFLFIRVVLFTFLLGISTLLQTTSSDVVLPGRNLINLFILFIYIYSIAAALLSQRARVNVRAFGLGQILSDIVFSACLVYATGCSQSIFTIVFIYPIIAGGLILQRRGALIPAATATLLYGICLTLEFRYLFPRNLMPKDFWPNEDPLFFMNIFSVYGLIFFLVALLSGMVAGRIRRAEQALDLTSRSLDRLLLLYKQIFDDIRTGIITVDDKDLITSFNPAAEQITGYVADEVSGRRLADCLPDLLIGKDSGRLRGDLTRKDGQVIRINYSFARLHLPEAARRRTAAGEQSCAHCKVITLADVSKIERMERQVRQAEKMAAIGEMSAAIAHDLRNPLAAISGSAQILAAEMLSAGRSRGDKDLMEIILRESERMSMSINEFLQFARPAQIEAELFNLHALVEEVLRPIRETGALTGIELVNKVGVNVDVHGDRQMIQSLCQHLVDNARFAMGKRAGAVTVEAGEFLDNERALTEILVRDSGPGIAPELLEEVFEPYFTTREKGAGLGLAIVKQIVDSHGGGVSLSNLPEGGCLVRVRLPLP